MNYLPTKSCMCVDKKKCQTTWHFIIPRWDFTSNDLKSVFDFYIELSFHAVYVMDSDTMDCHVPLYIYILYIYLLLNVFISRFKILYNIVTWPINYFQIALLHNVILCVRFDHFSQILSRNFNKNFKKVGFRNCELKTKKFIVFSHMRNSSEVFSLKLNVYAVSFFKSFT